MSISTRGKWRGRTGVLAVAAILMVGLLPAAPAAAAPTQADCDGRTNSTYAKLLECVRVGQVRQHQAAFQAIADENGGTARRGPPVTTIASTMLWRP